MLAFDQLSFWEKETYINHAEVVIIGSGIVGLSTAIHLKKLNPNQNILILERSYLPCGASTKNAGFACIGSPSELLDDLSKNTEEVVFETVKKRWKGLNYLRELLGDSNIDYQANGSYELFSSSHEESFQNSLKHLPYLNARLKEITGIQTVFETCEDIVIKNDFHGFTRAIRHHAEGQIDTGKMMQSLLTYAIELGVKVLNGIAIESIERQTIYTDYGKISCDQIAICTNGFAQQFLPDEDISPGRAQVIITRPIPHLKFKGIYHFDEGYYYFRNIGNRILFGGGRNINETGETTTKMVTTNEITDQLKRILSEQILPNTPYQVEDEWAGIMGIGQTKAPIIKKLNQHIYCAVRLGGMGVAIGSLVGKELAELMNNQ